MHKPGALGVPPKQLNGQLPYLGSRETCHTKNSTPVVTCLGNFGRVESKKKQRYKVVNLYMLIRVKPIRATSKNKCDPAPFCCNFPNSCLTAKIWNGTTSTHRVNA